MKYSITRRSSLPGIYVYDDPLDLSLYGVTNGTIAYTISNSSLYVYDNGWQSMNTANLGPVFTDSPLAISFTSGDTYDYLVTATDPEGLELAWSVNTSGTLSENSSVELLDYDGTNGSRILRVNSSNPKDNFDILLTISDGLAGTLVTIPVTVENRLPTITVAPLAQINDAINGLYTFTYAADDLDDSSSINWTVKVLSNPGTAVYESNIVNSEDSLTNVRLFGLYQGWENHNVYGWSTAVSGNTMAIGRCTFKESAPYVDIFVLENGVWKLQQRIYGPDTYRTVAISGSADNIDGTQFGSALALIDDYLMIGDWRHNRDEVTNYGRAYLYKRTDGVWTQEIADLTNYIATIRGTQTRYAHPTLDRFDDYMARHPTYFDGESYNYGIGRAIGVGRDPTGVPFFVLHHLIEGTFILYFSPLENRWVAFWTLDFTSILTRGFVTSFVTSPNGQYLLGLRNTTAQPGNGGDTLHNLSNSMFVLRFDETRLNGSLDNYTDYGGLFIDGPIEISPSNPAISNTKTFYVAGILDDLTIVTADGFLSNTVETRNSTPNYLRFWKQVGNGYTEDQIVEYTPTDQYNVAKSLVVIDNNTVAIGTPNRYGAVMIFTKTDNVWAYARTLSEPLDNVDSLWTEDLKSDGTDDTAHFGWRMSYDASSGRLIVVNPNRAGKTYVYSYGIGTSANIDSQGVLSLTTLSYGDSQIEVRADDGFDSDTNVFTYTGIENLQFTDLPATAEVSIDSQVEIPLNVISPNYIIATPSVNLIGDWTVKDTNTSIPGTGIAADGNIVLMQDNSELGGSVKRYQVVNNALEYIDTLGTGCGPGADYGKSIYVYDDWLFVGAEYHDQGLPSDVIMTNLSASIWEGDVNGEYVTDGYRCDWVNQNNRSFYLWRWTVSDARTRYGGFVPKLYTINPDSNATTNATYVSYGHPSIVSDGYFIVNMVSSYPEGDSKYVWSILGKQISTNNWVSAKLDVSLTDDQGQYVSSTQTGPFNELSLSNMSNPREVILTNRDGSRAVLTLHHQGWDPHTDLYYWSTIPGYSNSSYPTNPNGGPSDWRSNLVGGGFISEDKVLLQFYSSLSPITYATYIVQHEPKNINNASDNLAQFNTTTELQADQGAVAYYGNIVIINTGVYEFDDVSNTLNRLFTLARGIGSDVRDKAYYNVESGQWIVNKQNGESFGFTITFESFTQTVVWNLGLNTTFGPKHIDYLGRTGGYGSYPYKGGQSVNRYGKIVRPHLPTWNHTGTGWFDGTIGVGNASANGSTSGYYVYKRVDNEWQFKSVIDRNTLNPNSSMELFVADRKIVKISDNTFAIGVPDEVPNTTSTSAVRPETVLPPMGGVVELSTTDDGATWVTQYRGDPNQYYITTQPLVERRSAANYTWRKDGTSVVAHKNQLLVGGGYYVTSGNARYSNHYLKYRYSNGTLTKEYPWVGSSTYGDGQGIFARRYLGYIGRPRNLSSLGSTMLVSKHKSNDISLFYNQKSEVTKEVVTSYNGSVHGGDNRFYASYNGMTVNTHVWYDPSIAADSSRLVFNGDFTMEGWVKDVGTSATVINSTNAAANNNTWFVRVSTNDITLGIWNDQYSFATSVFNSSNWGHFALVRTNGILACYVNGTKLATTHTVGGFNANSSYTTNTTGPYNDGNAVTSTTVKLHAIKIYKRAKYSQNFTPNEVDTLEEGIYDPTKILHLFDTGNPLVNRVSDIVGNEPTANYPTMVPGGPFGLPEGRAFGGPEWNIGNIVSGNGTHLLLTTDHATEANIISIYRRNVGSFKTLYHIKDITETGKITPIILDDFNNNLIIKTLTGYSLYNVDFHSESYVPTIVGSSLTIAPTGTLAEPVSYQLLCSVYDGTQTSEGVIDITVNP